MVRRRAGGGDRIINALDLEPRGKRRRGSRRHGLGDRERPDALWTLATGGVGGLHDGAGRGTARTHDDAGALVRNLVVGKTSVADRLLHGDMVPGGTAAEKAHRAAVDRARGLEGRA